MEQLNPSYDCCNYCKYFKVINGNFEAYSTSGICCNPLFPIGKGQSSHVFYYSCIAGCFHTIHNHYNVESPEYIQEYKKTLFVRRRLRTDIFCHNQRGHLELQRDSREKKLNLDD